jgi:hypothetical protein
VFPVYSTWPQPGGPGSPLTLTYSFSNLLDGSIRDGGTGQPIAAEVLRGAFEQAFRDYAAVLRVSFVEMIDLGPAPESGPYDATGLADIRIGQVPHVDDANAYAYFPAPISKGLGGDIVFNAGRFGNDWSPVLFYAVAQHEVSHSPGPRPCPRGRCRRERGRWLRRPAHSARTRHDRRAAGRLRCRDRRRCAAVDVACARTRDAVAARRGPGLARCVVGPTPALCRTIRQRSLLAALDMANRNHYRLCRV